MTGEDFLENDEVQEVAESHVARLLSLEKKESERIIKVYKGVRQELRDRLDSMGEGTFTAQRLRGVLFQIESAIQAMSGQLKSEMDSSAQSSAELGIENLLSEITDFNSKFQGAIVPINIDALAIATDTKNFLFNRYETSMDSYNQNLRARFSQGLTQAVIEQASMAEVVSKIGKTFMGEQWQIERIVRTELHGIYSLGKINAMTDLWDEGKGDIPDLRKALYHPMDKRTATDSKYAAALELIVPIDEPFVYKWKGETRKFMSPPDRPNDRSILIPYRQAWS